jgi:hypothetical protein
VADFEPERPADEAPIARCTVERLMGELGLAGAVWGKGQGHHDQRLQDPEAAGPGRPATSLRWHQTVKGHQDLTTEGRGT